MTATPAAAEVRDDLRQIGEKHHRALHDQILEQLADHRPLGANWHMLTIGQGGRYRAMIGAHRDAPALLAIGEWRDHELSVGGHQVTRFGHRRVRSGSKWLDDAGTLLNRDGSTVIAVVVPAPSSAARLEALILDHSPRLTKLYRARLATLDREPATVASVFHLS